MNGDGNPQLPVLIRWSGPSKPSKDGYLIVDTMDDTSCSTQSIIL